VDYNTVTAAIVQVVNQTTPVVNWPVPAAITYGTALSSVQLDASSTTTGSFAYTPPTGAVLTAGVQTLSVTFTPTDAIHNSVVTQTVPITINKAPLTVTASTFAITFGQPIPALTSTITGFVNGDTAATAITGTPTLTLTPPAPTAAGTYPITAAAGTLAAANYSFQFVNGSLVINKAASTISLSAPATGNLGTPITLTATLNVSAPAGSVTFYDGATAVGVVTANGSSNVITYAVTLSIGSHTLTAVYSGDTNYLPSPTSNAQVITVAAPSYSLSLTPTSLSISAGQTALTMSPIGNFTGTVNLTCTGLPDWAGCSFTPASLTADGAGTPLDSHLTITTLGPATGTVSRLQPRHRTGIFSAALWLPFSLIGMLLLLGTRRSRASIRGLLLMLFLSVALVTVSGCGTADCCSVPSATPGTYQVVITGTSTGSAAQTITFTLQVRP